MITELTEHFTLDEMEFSDTAIRLGVDNSIPEKYMANVRKIAIALEKIRAFQNKPIKVTSCYRSQAVNDNRGGSKTSAHMTASAVDFRILGIKNIDVCNSIPNIITDFDQVIYEFGPTGQIHLGIAEKPRKQLLTAIKQNNKTVYLPGIVG